MCHRSPQTVLYTNPIRCSIPTEQGLRDSRRVASLVSRLGRINTDVGESSLGGQNAGLRKRITPARSVRAINKCHPRTADNAPGRLTGSGWCLRRTSANVLERLDQALCETSRRRNALSYTAVRPVGLPVASRGGRPNASTDIADDATWSQLPTPFAR